jgi:hypothetical protein
MMLEKLGTAPPFDAATAAANPKALSQRLQLALEDPSTNPPDPPVFDVKPLPPDPKDIINVMVDLWVQGEFMQTMIFDDEEKTGMKPDSDV